MDKLALTVVTPRGYVVPAGFTGKAQDGVPVDEVTATGIAGEFGVLPGHLPLLTYLRPGPLHFRQGNEQRWVAVRGGIALVGPTAVTILADAAEYAEEIDVVRAKNAQEKAARLLESGGLLEDPNYQKAQAKYARAMVRLAVAEHARKVV